MRVRFGSNEISQQEEVDATNWCIHKGFAFERKGYDLGMIKLARKLSYVPGRLQPACLRLDLQHHPGALCAMAGFGLDAEGRQPDRLMAINFMRNCDQHSLEPSSTCYSRPKPTELGGTFKGDSGSGLYCFDSCRGLGQRAYLVGAVSAGINKNWPSDLYDGKKWYQNFADFHGMSEAVEEMIRILHNREGVDKHNCYPSPAN